MPLHLLQLIRDTEDVRKLHIEPTTQSAIADTPTKQSEPVPGSLTCDLAADAVSASVHTELLESSGVAVLQLKVPPGQAPVSGAALAGECLVRVQAPGKSQTVQGLAFKGDLSQNTFN